MGGKQRGQVDYVALDRLLSGETVTAADLSAAASVAEPAARASIRRILGGLKRWVTFEKAGRTMYAIRLRGARDVAASAVVDVDLLRSISIAHSLMGGLAGTDVRAALRKHLDQLLQEQATTVDDYSRRLRARARAMRPNQSGAIVTDAVLRALFESRQLALEYTNTRNVHTAVQLEPLTLLLDDLGLHLYAKCTKADEAPDRVGKYATYALQRIDSNSIRLLDRFAYPATDEYNPDTVFGPAFGLFVPRANEGGIEDVLISFDPGWRSYLDTVTLHPTQVSKLLESTDGTVVAIEVSLKVYVTYDLVHWIRGHGNGIRVIRPKRLKLWVESGAGLDGPPESS